MRAASKLGLHVAEVDILQFEEEPAFVTRRCDRAVVRGDVLRIHQEDLCQVFGVAPSRKYERQGAVR